MKMAMLSHLQHVLCNKKHNICVIAKPISRRYGGIATLQMQTFIIVCISPSKPDFNQNTVAYTYCI